MPFWCGAVFCLYGNNITHVVFCQLIATTGEKVANQIRPEIIKLATPIASLTPHPRNVRQGDVGAIVTSLEQHGQYRPIVVQKETGHILAGNHTYQAAKALKWDKVAVTFVECDDEQALKILLADNRANDLASYDDHALVELLTELADTTGLDGTLFEPEDLQSLLEKLQPDVGAQGTDPSGNPVDFGETFEVVITCENEYQQTMLLEKLSSEGLKVRAIVI
jgi:ParB-like chromosome segregation protein Spo0J